MTRANGDAQDRLGGPTESGQVRSVAARLAPATLTLRRCVLQIGVIDPECRMIALHMYDGALKIIPMDAKGALKEAFNVRLDELQARHRGALRNAASPD